ncbi:protein of unknown function [Azospirillum baldaniorum]|uniref:Hcy-binding domain-containing protein n=1 Tax=Azospirillum baldaniorum TaxID=1064539 RepID=A0A9P1JRK1_9PROT|nr:protein of unknown function [Azospirillum baldaniorum]
MPHILDTLRDRVLLCDGGFGSRIQALDLDVEKDYWGHENCTDILPLSRPDIVREIHRGYFEAGADMVETDTFGASPVTLGEFGISEKAFEINQRAVELAREAAETFTDGQPRFVIGSVGPGTKLPSLGHIPYQDLEDSFFVQAAGLIAGGADAILVETCQDPLQIKAAVNGIKRARAEAGSDTPVFVQVTVETTGTLLVGTDIAAAATVIQALDVPLMGLNCATGPLEMSEHVKWLTQNWPGTRLRAAERRPAGTGRRQDALPAARRRLRPLAGALRDRGRGEPRRRLLWHQRSAHRGGQPDAAQAGPGRVAPPEPEGPHGPLGACGRLALLAGHAAPGERFLRHRRALQRQRLQEVARASGEERLGRLRRDGARAGEGRFAHAGRLHRLRRPRRGGGDEGRRAALRRLGHRPAGHRLHRIHRSGEGAGALRRQGDHQLHQLRGRRGAGPQAPRARQEVRRGGDRSDHRRGGHGEDAGAQARRRQAPLRPRGQRVWPAGPRPAVRPADLHHRHRQRGRPQAGHLDAGGHRGDQPRDARLPDHPGPVQRLLRPERGGPPRAELGLPRPCGEARHDRRHRACVEDHAAAPDPGKGGQDRRGPDLRPPRGRV